MHEFTENFDAPNGNDFSLYPPSDFSDALETLNHSLGPQKSQRDIRRHPRTNFQFTQFVAPVKNGSMPWLDDFIEVHCLDISPGGIALLMKLPPSTDELVIRLGQDESQTFMLAKVVRVQKNESGDQRGYRVGCQFVERVTLSEDSKIQRHHS
jgi:hypothetical protein